jgi:formate C-acetyltransferase
MSERVQRLREKYINIVPSVCAERAVIFTDAIKKHTDAPMIVARAIALSRVLGEMTIYIDEDALLVGNQASRPRAAVICPEYSFSWVENELDTIEKRTSDVFQISEDVKKRLKESFSFWKGRTLQDRAFFVQPEAAIEEKKVGVLGWEGNITAGDGHIIVDYETIVTRGIRAIRDEAAEKLDALDLCEPDELRKLYFYQAAVITLDGAMAYMQRYSMLSKEMADTEKGEKRKQELLDISARCSHLENEPPGTFLEALQLVWFVHVIMHIETNGHSISLGRLDQYLYPFYQRDMASGVLDREMAADAIGCLYIKIFGNIKLRSWNSTRTQLGYPTYQNICLGGQHADGSDATNELSYLCLDVLSQTRLSEPNIYIRVHPRTPQTFMCKAVQILCMGLGMPAMVNDEVIVPSLMDRGVSHEDALGYSTFGCCEVSVPGKWGYRANGKCKVNVLKVLEIALNAGVDPVSGIEVVKNIKPLREMATFDEVKKVYRTVLDHYMRLQVTVDNINDMIMEEMVPDALCSSLIRDCLKRGKTIKQGGAVYDVISGVLIGIPNVGNSLYAIKDLVFDRALLTLEELTQALSANFEGLRGAEIQHMLFADAKKFGNDEDAVDMLVKEISDYYFKNIPKYKNMRYGLGPIGGNFTSSTVTISGNVPAGRIIGATPDGRCAQTPTVDGVSPMHRTQTQGPTAVLNSVAKLSTRYVSGGQLLNMRFQPGLLSSDEKIDKFIALIRGFFRKQGWHIQFNIVSNDVLRDAQKNPSEYRDLVVRVAGYSALFTALDKETQDDIIDRQEYHI